MKPRKKDKGKNHERQCDSGSFNAALKRFFTCFRSRGAKRALKDFSQNSGFAAAIKLKWKEIASAGAAFGVRCCAAAHDRNGDKKTRAKRVVDEVFSDKTMFIYVLAMQTQRNCALRGEAEPVSLK